MRPRGVVASVVAAVVLAATAAGAWSHTRGGDARDPVVAAVDAIPAGSGTVDVTVWSRLSGSIVDDSLADLTTRSVVANLDAELRDLFGWGPSDLDWEAYARTTHGRVVVLGLGSLDPSRVEKGFAKVGSAEGEGWDLSEAQASTDLRDTFKHVRVLDHRGVVVAGDTVAGVDATVATIEGRHRSLLADRSVAELVRAAAGRDSVLLKRQEALCVDDSLDESEAAAMQRIEAQHGRLTDPTWGMRAVDARPDRRIVFGTTFASLDEARRQLDIRTALTEGPFYGRGGDVSDSLRDLHASVDGTAVLLDLAMTPDAEAFMTDAGPVVFSGCSDGAPSRA